MPIPPLAHHAILGALSESADYVIDIFAEDFTTIKDAFSHDDIAEDFSVSLRMTFSKGNIVISGRRHYYIYWCIISIAF